ncbi:arginine transporter [Pseudooctadecabacter sp.]|uniref:arginine transporter n=1 Tax=Pseudooctadecabacter sp. TaxID=1966338 RepID=UPI0035C79B89
MRAIVLLTCMVALAACGGRSGSTRGATGEISRACLAADRSAASVQLCTCVQGVANAELSARDRSRVASFFDDPEVAHATKISDTRANDAFWDRYRSFISASRRQCG